MEKTLDNNLKGPPSYENWKVYSKHISAESIFEYPLFSDAKVTGENTDDFGPYSFLNPVPFENKSGLIQPILYIRIEICLKEELPDMSKTNSERYHGGELVDEIAALSSLALGIRFKAGGITRYFGPEGDPRGHPAEWSSKPKPFILVENRRLKLPFVVSKRSINELKPLSILPRLSPYDAIILIRVARLYQDALWIAESDPSLAWIMLVSAIETAATHWRKSEDTPIERLRVSKPELVELLDSSCKEGVSNEFAEIIKDSIGSTKKFIDFIIKFLPDPPKKRPPEYAQFPWEKKKMKNAMNKIYEYRSLALHDGRPFPYPMWMSPQFKDSSGIIYQEKHFSSAISTMGGTWKEKDVPMFLHTFEYIARNALLKWWKTLYTN